TELAHEIGGERELPGDAADAVGAEELAHQGLTARKASSARRVAPTSWTRTTSTPASAARQATAREPSSRCSGVTGSAPDWAARRPRNALREAPRTTGRPSVLNTSSCLRISRLWSKVFPKPMPGSIHARVGSPPAAAKA